MEKTQSTQHSLYNGAPSNVQSHISLIQQFIWFILYTESVTPPQNQFLGDFFPPFTFAFKADRLQIILADAIEMKRSLNGALIANINSTYGNIFSLVHGTMNSEFHLHY